MSESSPTPQLTSVARIAKNSDVLFAVGMVCILGLLVMPIPTSVLSILLAGNLSMAMGVLLVAIYTKEPLEFNTFPSVLLVTTLVRLGLNVPQHGKFYYR